MKIINLLSNVIYFSLILSHGLSSEKYKFIQTSFNEPAKWISSSEYDNLLRSGTHFVDKTDDNPQGVELKSIFNTYTIPQEINNKDLTERAHRYLSTGRAKEFLTILSSFHTRFYNTTSGYDAALFIKSHAQGILKSYSGKSIVEEYSHTWKQPSIIVRLPGTKRPDEIVILGAHLDSINQKNPEFGRSPGADDDGSGSALLMQVLESLVKLKFRPQRTLEFQFYAAEEVGLKGSRAIARDYRNKLKNVVSMLQQDMVGYKAPGVDTMRVMNDFSDPQLTQFIRTLITSYTPYPVKNDVCVYACSDHASFFEVGYKSAIQSETVLARGYHTENDVIDDIDFEYFNEFCKVAVAYAIEISEPSKY